MNLTRAIIDIISQSSIGDSHWTLGPFPRGGLGLGGVIRVAGERRLFPWDESESPPLRLISLFIPWNIRRIKS